MVLGESSCPDGSESVWQRGVENLHGRVTAAKSWPLFQERKKYFRRCNENLAGRSRTKPSWEDVQNINKKLSREDFALKAKLRRAKFLLHHPILTGNWRSTAISQSATHGQKGPTASISSIFGKLMHQRLIVAIRKPFSASYEASDFCWQIGVNFPPHLRPCRIQFL